MANEELKKVRSAYLSEIKSPKWTSEQLLDALTKAEMRASELLSDFQPESGNNALDDNPISWSATYFSQHLLLTKHNFARERIEHLLRVRDHLRQLGVKGFVPLNVPPQTHTTGEPTVTLNYTPSANLRKFVEEGNLLTIRTALRMELDDNSLRSADLRAALAWSKPKVLGLFDTYSEAAFARGMEAVDQATWTSSYYESQVVYLKSNFCEERFRHLIEVRNFLCQQGVLGFEPRAANIQPASEVSRYVASEPDGLVDLIMKLIDKALAGIEKGAAQLRTKLCSTEKKRG